MKSLHNEMAISSNRIKVITSLISLKREISIEENIKRYYSTIFDYILYENKNDINYNDEYSNRIIELLNNSKYKNSNEKLMRNMILISCNYNYDEYECIYIYIYISLLLCI